jgi:hypothetical protein
MKMFDDFYENMTEMNYHDLKKSFDEIYDLYHKYDEPDELNRVAEYFRVQIDMIESYSMKIYNRSMFDGTTE